jgi:hypothetical protein
MFRPSPEAGYPRLVTHEKNDRAKDGVAKLCHDDEAEASFYFHTGRWPTRRE